VQGTITVSPVAEKARLERGEIMKARHGRVGPGGRIGSGVKGALVASVALLAAPAACGDDDNEARRSGAGESCLRTDDCGGALVCVAQVCVDAALASPRAPGRRGESCRVSAECAAGLSCMNDVCAASEFAVSPTANECKIIECKAAQDCCPPQPTFCADFKAQCDLELAAPPPAPACGMLKAQCDGGDAAACDTYSFSCPSCAQFDAACDCDLDARRCDEGACRLVEPCVNGTCFTGVCDAAANECVACVKAEDCGDPERLTCNARRCEARCTDDTDCSAFSRCSAGACVPAGCKTDRECKASTRNALATCGQDGVCVEPCESDPECGTSDAWNFRSCIEGRCTYVGCETDKECQLYLSGGGLPEPPFSDRRDIVCVPKQAPPPAAP
jgi:hypothetical protein